MKEEEIKILNRIEEINKKQLEEEYIRLWRKNDTIESILAIVVIFSFLLALIGLMITLSYFFPWMS